MRVLIIGAAGMIGARVAQALTSTGHLGKPITNLMLIDRAEPRPITSDQICIETKPTDITDMAAVAELAAWKPDLVFHLAAVVSGEAEARFDLGYRVNVTATWSLLETLREAGCRPRLVFASSLAVYGPPLPDPVPDTFHLTPQSSYGTQKAVGELLVSDYTRKGFVDGVSIRLPTIVVRPGAPNAAASGFLSSIIREPLAGRETCLPVPESTAAWIASPDVAVQTLLHAATLPTQALGADRSLTGRGLSVTVAEMIEALRDVAGASVAARIRSAPDPEINRIVCSWPRRFTATRAAELGFPVDRNLHDIIAAHMRDTGAAPALA